MADRDQRTTILRPPEPDKSKAPIENVLEVTELGVLGPDIFTNTRQPWHPPGARGIYGGAVIAQCLASAFKTVPAEFLPHSCHCYFLLAGSSSIPILFHVERVRDGRSFATRTVQARQKGRCIFTTTISFARTDSNDDDNASGKRKKTVNHAAGWPEGELPPPPADDSPDLVSSRGSSPFESGRIEIHRGDDPSAAPQDRRCRTWMRSKGTISEEGGHQAHLNALAYMSDSFFIGTVSRIHGLWRFPFSPRQVLGDASTGTPGATKAQAEAVRRAMEFEGMGTSLEEWEGRPQVGMLVSLDHSIYFHEPTMVRADEWMFSEMESPWAGEERGVVGQRIFARDGTLLASCMQEGVVRLKQDGGEKGSKL